MASYTVKYSYSIDHLDQSKRNSGEMKVTLNDAFALTVARNQMVDQGMAPHDFDEMDFQFEVVDEQAEMIAERDARIAELEKALNEIGYLIHDFAPEIMEYNDELAVQIYVAASIANEALKSEVK